MQQASESKRERRRDSQRRRRRGWSRELRERGMGSDRGRGGQRAGSCNSIYFFLFYIFCACHLQRETAHYCNSTETDNNIKPSVSKHCFEVKYAIIKTLPRQHEAEKPLSETGLSDLSFSVCVCMCVCLCLCFSLFVRYKQIGGEGKWSDTEREEMV